MSDKKLLIGIVLLVAVTVISFHVTDVYAAIAMVPNFMFGSGLNGNANFTFPDSVAVDSKGNVFVVDQDNSRIQKFFPNGTHNLTFGSDGSGLGQLSDPDGIAIDSSDNVWVVDSSNNRIQKFNENGTALLTLGSFGSADGDFNIPVSIAINSTGHVFVVDQQNSRVQIFNSQGQHLLSFDDGGSLSTSLGAIAVNSTNHIFVDDSNVIKIFDDTGTLLKSFTPTLSPNIAEIFINSTTSSTNKIFVADRGGNQILRYDSNFTSPLILGGTQGTGEGEFAVNSPRGVAVDSSGNIYASDYNNHRFQKFNSDFTYQYSVGANKTAGGGMDAPKGIAINSTGYIFLADTDNDRIQVFNSTGDFELTFGFGVADGSSAFQTCTSFCNVGISGSGTGQFDTPVDVYVNGTAGTNNHIFVSDQGNERIQIFDNNFVHKQTISVSGSTPTPAGIAVNNTAIFLVDNSNDNVRIFDLSGNPTLTFGTSGQGNTDLDFPLGIAVNSTGYIHVADDFFPSRIQVFDSDGTHVAKYEGDASCPSDIDCFVNALDVDIDKDNNIYVMDGFQIHKLDSDGNSLQVLGTFGVGLGAFTSAQGIAVDPSVSNPTVVVADTGADRVQVFIQVNACPTGCTLSTIANPSSIILSPTGTAQTNVTITVTGFGSQKPFIEVFPSANAPGATISSVVIDDIDITGGGGFGSFQYDGFSTKRAELTYTSAGTPPGDYISFFDVFTFGLSPSDKFVFLDIPVIVIDPSIPLLKFNVTGAANSTGHVLFDGFNLEDGDTASLSIAGPGFSGNQLLAIDSFTVEKTTGGKDVTADGRIQGIFTVPASITVNSTFAITLSTSSHTPTEELFVFDSRSSGIFSLNLAFASIELIPPDFQPQSPNFAPGTTLSYTSLGGFTGQVDIEVLGLPPGVFVFFDNDDNFDFADNGELTVANGQGSGSLLFMSFTTSPETSPGFYEVIVEGCDTATGLVCDDVDLDLIVPCAESFEGTGDTACGVFSVQPSHAQIGDLVIMDGVLPEEFSGETLLFFIGFGDALTTLAPVIVQSDGSFSGSFIVPDLSSSTTGYNVGFMGIEAFVPDGPNLFTEFSIIGADATFTTTVSPDYITPIISGDTGTSGQHELTVTIDGLAGSNSDTITLSVFGLPPGLNVQFDESGRNDADGSVQFTLPAGGKVVKKILFDATDDPPSGSFFAFVDVFSSTTNEFFFFDIPIAVILPVGTYSFGDLTLFNTDNSTTQTISGSFRNMGLGGFGFPVEINFAGTTTSVEAGTCCDGNQTFSLPVPNVSPGIYKISASNGTGGYDEEPFTVVSGSDTFSASVSPFKLPAIQQGTVSANKATFTVRAFSGQNLTKTCTGGVDIEMFGLPPGITASFDSGSFSQFPSTAISVLPGGFNSTLITLNALSNAFPGPVEVFLEASCGGEIHGAGFKTTVLTGTSFFDFSGGIFVVGSYNAFSEATVFIDPDTVIAGNTTKLEAYGYQPDDTPSFSIFTGSTSLPVASSVTFNDSGNFTGVEVRIPGSLSPGEYEFDITDSFGTFGTAPFTVVSTTATFKMVVEPGTIEPLPPLTQGEQSGIISIKIAALAGKSPGSVDINLFGIPPGLITDFDGTNQTSTTLTVGTGLTKFSKLKLIPTFVTPPGFYYITIEADDGTTSVFADLEVVILPGGVLTSSFSSLTVSPPFGIAGDFVTIRGFGFTEGDDVGLEFGGTTISTGSGIFTSTFDSDGAFVATEEVPSSLTLPGLYPVTLFDESELEQTILFEVITADSSFILNVSPDYLKPIIQGSASANVTAKLKTPKGTVGSTTTISVEGLPSGVNPLFDGKDVDSVDLRLSSAGATNQTQISLEISSSTTPGFYEMYVVAKAGLELSVIPVGFSVAPDLGGGTTFASLLLDPPVIRPGESITVSGEGFTAGSAGGFSSLQFFVPGDPSPTTINFGKTITPGVIGNFSDPIRIANTTAPGFYIISVTSGSKTGEAELSVVPDGAFYSVKFNDDFLKVTQGTDVNTSLVNITMTIKPENGFSADLDLVVSQLPLGMSVKLDNFTGNNLATFNGTLGGNEANATATLTNGNQVVPGKPKIIIAKFGADSSTPVGTYQVSLSAVDNTDNDVRGRPITIQVVPAIGGAVSVTPPSSQALGKASITGSGVAAGAITVEFAGRSTGEDGFVIETGAITADSNNFTAVITVPNLDPGLYSINVTDSNSDSVFTQFQIFSKTVNTFELLVSPKKSLIETGQLVNHTVTITPRGSFTSDITISVSDLPSGFGTTTFSPAATITPFSGISTPITISLDSNTASVGESTYTITGTGGGVTVSESASVNILGSNDFAFGLGPDEIVLEKGGDSVFVNLQAVVTGTLASDPTLAVTLAPPTGVTVNGSANPTLSSIPIDSTTNIGNVVLEFTASNSAAPGNSKIEITPSGADAKAQNITISVVSGTVEVVTNPCFDPTSISTSTPKQILPKFSDGVNPQFIFDSVTTDASTCTEIFTTKSNDQTTDLGALPSGINVGGNQIFNVDVAAGNTQTDVKVCVPSSTLIDQALTPIAMFLNATLGKWIAATTTTIEGEFACTISNHTSSWAVGGVKALALGGAAGGGGGGPSIGLRDLLRSSFIAMPDEIEQVIINFDPFTPLEAFDVNAEQFETFDFPFSIDNDGYAIVGYSNTLDTKILNTGVATKIKTVFYMKSELEHVAFYTNIREGDSLDDSDAFLRFWKSESDIIQIKDENGFFEYIELTIEEDGIKKTATFDIKFANPMPKSDIVLRMWDEKLHSTTVIIFDAIEVVGPSIEPIEEAAPEDLEIPEPGTTVPETSELRIGSKIIIPDWIKTNAKWWNEGHITDTDFARGIEYLIENEIIKMPLTVIAKVTINEIASMPNWIKSSAGWWGDGLIPGDDFISGIKYLIEQGIIKV